jgi:peroxiredoxin family protein
MNMSEEKKPKKMAIIVHSESLDKLYTVFMLSSTGSAMDVETHLFFTFWGLNALKKGGLESAGLPGFMTIDTGMMKERIRGAKVPTLTELLKMCRQMGNVKIYACSTTMEMMGVKKEDLIPDVDDIVGAASFLSIALDSDVQLFI